MPGASQFPAFTVAPLGRYADIRRSQFAAISFSALIVNTDASNTNGRANNNDFLFVSCDPESYEGGNIDPSTLLRIITNQAAAVNGGQASLIFYSTRSNHCNSTAELNTLPLLVGGIFTTLDPVTAAQIASKNFTETTNALGLLTADRSSYWSTASTQPTTAVAMIILYSITGIITALFIIIIITGAVRAHRHPERYGPRNGVGRPRQSRAKGIARAVLETLPIVKFGDHHDVPKDKKNSTGDVELAAATTPKNVESTKSDGKSAPVTTTTTAVADTTGDTPVASHVQDNDKNPNPDGTDEIGSLGCSICTEDFQKGEEVRVLPCNHKFHPDCVDPWLLNVSGTCPLCRIALTSQDEATETSTAEESNAMPPPLVTSPAFSDRRSQAIHNLMAMAYGSREERIAALQRYRSDRRVRQSVQVNEDERVSRARRFREAFRIRTRRHEVNESEAQRRNSEAGPSPGVGG